MLFLDAMDALDTVLDYVDDAFLHPCIRAVQV